MSSCARNFLSFLIPALAGERAKGSDGATALDGFKLLI